jgi:DNA-binding transcriptional MocR family regulator
MTIGITLCSPELREPLARSQFYQTQGVSSFIQAAFAQYVGEGFLTNHLRRTARTYAERRHALWQAVSALKMLPKPIQQPKGGFSMVVPLPEGFDPKDVYQQLLDLGFAVVPGPLLWTSEPAPYLRMSHSLQPTERIRSAVEALGKVLST